jgi:tripartite-type tricarboxylate transporter receptor subunit TctC
MHKAIGVMIERPDVQNRLEALGLVIVPPQQRTPEYLAAFLPKEIERWSAAIRAAGISVN